MAKQNKKPDYKAHLFSFKYILFDLIKWFGSWQCLLWYRIKKIYDGKESKKRPKGKVVISSNHVAFSDPFVLQCTILTRRWHFLYMTDSNGLLLISNWNRSPASVSGTRKPSLSIFSQHCTAIRFLPSL